MQYQKSPRRVYRLPQVAVLAGASVALTGCTEELKTGFLPSTPDTTNHTGMIINLWNGTWVAGLAVGIIVWALILGCAFVYRRREGDGTPEQIRYHVPLEIMYTVIPLFMIGAFFVATERGFSQLEARNPNPDVKIQVIGKQWAWDFNYLSNDVYETSTQVHDIGNAKPEDLPVLYLPVNKSVEIQLDARDVIHSFWIPAFLYKKDMIPGRTNFMTVTPQKTGIYDGKCAELCGEYHSEMVFRVAVVEEDEFSEKMEELRAKGQTGALSLDLSRQEGPEKKQTNNQGVGSSRIEGEN